MFVPGNSSTLEFQFVQAGAKTTGRFSRFTADIDFSAANPATGKFDVAIDMGSADTRDKERDDTLRMPDLFNIVKFPRATYVASQFVAKGAGFEGKGKLTLRGLATYTKSFLTECGVVGTIPVQSAGVNLGNTPKWKTQFSQTWESDNASFSVGQC